MALCCGIPNVTLLGTKKDYVLLSKKVDKLLQFELEGNKRMQKWHAMLKYICHNLILTLDDPTGQTDFWQCICSNVENPGEIQSLTSTSFKFDVIDFVIACYNRLFTYLETCHPDFFFVFFLYDLKKKKSCLHSFFFLE